MDWLLQILQAILISSFCEKWPSLVSYNVYFVCISSWAVSCSNLNALLPNEPRNSVCVCACVGVYVCVCIYMHTRWSYLGFVRLPSPPGKCLFIFDLGNKSRLNDTDFRQFKIILYGLRGLLFKYTLKSELSPKLQDAHLIIVVS